MTEASSTADGPAAAGRGDGDAAASASPSVAAAPEPYSFTESQLARLARSVTPLDKVARNLNRLGRSIREAGRQPVVLVTTGSYNPPHLMHLRMFYTAKRHLEERTHYFVVGGLMSPAHEQTVRSINRNSPVLAIPAVHRVRMCDALTASSSWIDVDRWDATRYGPMDHPNVLEHVAERLGALQPFHVRPMYLCGTDHLITCRPATIQAYGCVCVTRPGYSESVVDRIGTRWRGSVHVVGDHGMLSRELDAASSTRARRLMTRGEQVAPLVGDRVMQYIARHGLCEKVRGDVPWSLEERSARPGFVPRAKTRAGPLGVDDLSEAASAVAATGSAHRSPLHRSPPAAAKHSPGGGSGHGWGATPAFAVTPRLGSPGRRPQGARRQQEQARPWHAGWAGSGGSGEARPRLSAPRARAGHHTASSSSALPSSRSVGAYSAGAVLANAGAAGAGGPRWSHGSLPGPQSAGARGPGPLRLRLPDSLPLQPLYESQRRGGDSQPEGSAGITARDMASAAGAAAPSREQGSASGSRERRKPRARRRIAGTLAGHATAAAAASGAPPPARATAAADPAPQRSLVKAGRRAMSRKA